MAIAAIGLLGFAAVMFFPTALAYTQWFGDRAVATVTYCDPVGRNPNCHGTWVGGDGQHHSGEIDEVDSHYIGEQVRVRLGPLGPRRESISGKVAYLAMFLAFGSAPIGAIVMLRRTLRRRRQAGDEALAIAVPYGMTRLFVKGKRVWRLDGREIAVLRPTRAPPAFAPITLPGRIPHARSGSVLEVVRWLAYNPSKSTRFVAVDNPDGVPLFVFHRIPAGSFTPETAVLDPGGPVRAIIRRVREYPGAFLLLAADGRQLGSIEQSGGLAAAYTLRDEHGRETGRLVCHWRMWTLQVEDGSPLRDLALAFAADAYRLLN
jgi:hypothetical protein